MSETIEKLSPGRDLQCFFFRPSGIAALSEASDSGFTVSGTWRQQFDWVVIEWNRDNVYEHPLLRYLPDGDLSGLTLSYREERNNCIPIDSKLNPTVDWPYLRIWAEDTAGDEHLYYVRLADLATPVEGSYVNAQATFALEGTLSEGDWVELSWRDEHFNWPIGSSDTITLVLEQLRDQINTHSVYLSATVSSGDGTITLENLTAGEEGNRLGIVAQVLGAQTEEWSPSSQTMSGGESPSQWQIDLDFSVLHDKDETDPLVMIPTERVRKMRWTYAAALQPGAFERTEFDVQVTDWTVTGTNRAYKVAGRGSRRVEDNDKTLTYTGSWEEKAGNFSAGTIHLATAAPSSVSVPYKAQVSHRLFLGSRRTFDGGVITVTVDDDPEQEFDLVVAAEDFLVRFDLGSFGPGNHTVEATLTSGESFYFDFLELAVESSTVEAQPAHDNETLATDWDTDHSLALAPERVAWNLHMLGFEGRANHYAGAILFYELMNPGNVYAQATVTFTGEPQFGEPVEILVDETSYSRVMLLTDTPESIARSFELLINDGSTGIWASASGNVLTIQARTLGSAGNDLTLSATPDTGDFLATASGSNFDGGQDGPLNVRDEPWFVDTEAVSRINRAARDWHRAYFAALKGYGIDVTAAFSTELAHGDPSVSAGMAQRYPDGSAVVVSTPAVQTNFSPTSIDYWKQVYLEMAQIQDEAEVDPYLQFGEVQWWYFPKPVPPEDPPVGMTFYDDYTTSEFQSQYERALQVFLSNDDSIESYPEEAEFLPGLLAAYTEAIRDFVQSTYAGAKFEVLYPHDVNDHALTRVVNFASSDWTPANLEVLKTESFGHTFARHLDKALESIRLPFDKGFARNRAAHLIGVYSPADPWNWERRLAHAQGIESVVLWAFDQFSMVGYKLPLREGVRTARFLR